MSEHSRRDIRRGLSVADRKQLANVFGFDQPTIPGSTRSKPVPWTSGQIAQLRKLANDGNSAAEIAETLGRSLASVRQAAHRARISLRRPGERRGIVLGQPRGSRWRHPLNTRHATLMTIREGVLAGTIDISVLESIAARPALLARGVPLCPNCVCRPQEVEKTGLCRECHLDALTAAHATASSYREAVRSYNREKQRSSRRNRREQAGA